MNASTHLQVVSPVSAEARFVARLATDAAEVESAMRLRYRVFGEELGSNTGRVSGLDCDAHDAASQHLLLIDRVSGETIGTYRMKSIEGAGGVSGFYSNDEFSLETIPSGILENGIEIGRACIAPEHRNTRAIFLLWKALAQHLASSGKRYFFGCCSIFTDDPIDGLRAYDHLRRQGMIHRQYKLFPRRPISSTFAIDRPSDPFKLPGLFEMYLRIGSRVCGPPIYDQMFRTADFFVVFDLHEMDPKYRRIFLGN